MRATVLIVVLGIWAGVAYGACQGTGCVSCLKSDSGCAWCEKTQTCAKEEPFSSCPSDCYKKTRFGDLPEYCSATDCTAFTNCKSCAENNCAWCASSKKCNAVSAMTSLSTCPDDKCSMSCRQMKKRGEMPESCPAVDCGTKSDCASCTKEGCGWCASSETCVSVVEGQQCPDKPNCEGMQCLKSIRRGQPLTQCPAYKCSEHKNCGACLGKQDGQCAWCAEKQQCVEVVSKTTTCPDCGMMCTKRELKECPAVPVCSEQKDCTTCKATKGCGWCVSSQKCMETDSTKMPSVCEKGCKLGCDKIHHGSHGTCPAPTSNACAAYTSCTTCTQDLGCGWLSQENKCVEAGFTGMRCLNTDAKAWSYRDCNGACLSLPSNCTICQQGIGEVRCGFCEGYAGPNTRELGPLSSSCVLTNADNTAPARTDYRCSAYTGSVQEPPAKPALSITDKPAVSQAAASSLSSSSSSSATQTVVDPTVSVYATALVDANAQCVDCRVFGTRDECLAQSEAQSCGWCNRKCVRGREHGPFNADDCKADKWQDQQWFWQVHPVPCSFFFTCDTCAGMQDCGWCQSTMACMEGTAEGPWDGCPAVSKYPIEPYPWAFNRTMCNAVHCSSYDGCNQCMQDDRCVWCGRSGCKPGDAHGPLSDDSIHRSCTPYRFNNTMQCDDYCGKYKSANDCARDSMCGWCATTNPECVPGDNKGPLFKQCSPYYHAGKQVPNPRNPLDPSGSEDEGGDDDDPDKDSKKSGGLGTGAIVGIAVGGVVLLGGALFFLMKKQQERGTISQAPLLG